MSWQTVFLIIAATIIGRIGFEIYAKLYPPENLTAESLTGKQLVKKDDYFLVDIRSPSEWKDTGVIKGAHLLTFTSVSSFLDEIRPKLGPDQKLAVICRSGNRSSRAARKIAKQVNWDVVDIEGGMSRVLSEGYRAMKPTRAMGCESC